MAKILILDDQPVICEFIRMRLVEDGHDVRISHVGDDAIDIGHLFNPDILITDWHLKSDYDGLEVSEAVRFANLNVKTILISGYSLEEIGRTLDSRNIVAMLAKPFSIEKLAAEVQKALATDIPPIGFSLN